MVTINIHKKDLWLIAAIAMLLVGVGVVVAYNNVATASSSNVASTHGHSLDEIEIILPERPSTYSSTKTGDIWLCSDC